MPIDPKPEPASNPEDESAAARVGTPDMGGHEAENIEERGEPFDGNVA